jgi:uncharacterized protein YutE (UPF0331/DUF86 family)
MDVERQNQYSWKLEFIIDKISRLPENPAEDEFYWDALFYRLQVSIDTSMDVIAMLCKDVGISVGDDYSNIESLRSNSILDPEMLDEMRRLNGLRNILVHRYNKIEGDTVLAEEKQVVAILTDFATRVEEFVKNGFSNDSESI